MPTALSFFSTDNMARTGQPPIYSVEEGDTVLFAVTPWDIAECKMTSDRFYMPMFPSAFLLRRDTAWPFLTPPEAAASPPIDVLEELAARMLVVAAKNNGTRKLTDVERAEVCVTGPLRLRLFGPDDIPSLPELVFLSMEDHVGMHVQAEWEGLSWTGLALLSPSLIHAYDWLGPPPPHVPPSTAWERLMKDEA